MRVLLRSFCELTIGHQRSETGTQLVYSGWPHHCVSLPSLRGAALATKQLTIHGTFSDSYAGRFAPSGAWSPKEALCVRSQVLGSLRGPVHRVGGRSAAHAYRDRPRPRGKDRGRSRRRHHLRRSTAQISSIDLRLSFAGLANGVVNLLLLIADAQSSPALPLRMTEPANRGWRNLRCEPLLLTPPQIPPPQDRRPPVDEFYAAFLAAFHAIGSFHLTEVLDLLQPHPVAERHWACPFFRDPPQFSPHIPLTNPPPYPIINLTYLSGGACLWHNSTIIFTHSPANHNPLWPRPQKPQQVHRPGKRARTAHLRRFFVHNSLSDKRPSKMRALRIFDSRFSLITPYPTRPRSKMNASPIFQLSPSCA